MRFVPYEDLGDTPNIIVDGAGAPSTRLVLSHWPRSGTPAAVRADVSTEIVFRYLDRPDLHVAAEAVSNNHFDEDGLLGIYALLHPAEAAAQRALMVEAAEAGDFGRVRNRVAARTAITISALAAGAPDQDGGALYASLLARMPEVLGDIGRFRALWSEEDAAISHSEAGIANGRIRITEEADLDLAIVSLDRIRCHPMALHSATERLRILTMDGRRYELRFRYESWVQLASRRPAPRVDLAPLAERLTRQEAPGARWVFDGVEDITPALRLEGSDESRIHPGRFLDEVRIFLARAPAAWDPYAAPS